MDRMLCRILFCLFITLAVTTGAKERVLAQDARPASSDTPVATAGSKGVAGAASHAARPKHHKKAAETKTGVHARPWAFGGGGRSREPWRGGASTGDLQKRAVGAEAAKGNTVNTASGIDSALNATEDKNSRSGLAVSVGQNESSWRRKSSADIEAPDENLPMQSQHVVRAYADVNAGDDLNISLGPELILKDEQRERAAVNKQPESALGMGMRFKLDF